MVKKKRKQKNDYIINVKSKDKGLPAKSFVWIIDIDVYLKNALSLLSNTEFLDNYISKFLTWRFKYTHREKCAEAFINYMCIYDEERINCLFEFNKFFSRSEMLILISKVIDYLDKVKEKDINSINYVYFDLISNNVKEIIEKSFKGTLDKIIDIQQSIIDNFLPFAVKGLMSGRKGNDPNMLKTDAYQSIIDMIDNYDYNRSKSPFNNFLSFFIKGNKNKVIKEELANLDEGSFISIDEINDITEKANMISNIIQKRMLTFKDKENKFLTEQTTKYLPKLIRDVLSLRYLLLEPLNRKEEIKLLVNNKVK